MVTALCALLKKPCLPQGREDFFLCFLLEDFVVVVVLHFVFRSIITFNLIFVCDMRWGKTCIFPPGYTIDRAILVEKTIFLPLSSSNTIRRCKRGLFYSISLV